VLHRLLPCFGLVFATSALAGTVNEVELNGQAFNNARATAQFLGGGLFTPNASPHVFGNLPTANVIGHLGGNDVDFYSFSTGGGAAYFSTTQTTGGLDTYLALFNSSGTLIADNDDSEPFGPGSSLGDSFLGALNLPPGSYYLAITSGRNSASASFTGSMFTELARPDGAFGGFQFGDADFGVDSFLRNDVQLGDGAYTLNITIPAPGVAALAAIPILFSAARRRRA